MTADSLVMKIFHETRREIFRFRFWWEHDLTVYFKFLTVMISPRRDITAVDKNLRGMTLVSIYHYPIDDWYLGRVLGMRLRLKKTIFTTPEISGSDFWSVGHGRPRWLIMSRSLKPFFTAVWAAMNGTLIGLTTCLSSFSLANFAKIEAWRLKMVSNWWLANFEIFEISKRSKKTERSE